MITQIDNFLIHTHKACWFLCTFLSMPKNLTELNYPCSLYDLSEILHQIFLLCFPLWSDSRTTFMHGHRTSRLTKPFAQQRWGMPTHDDSDRMPQDFRRMAGEHTDSHRIAFCNNNFPVWVMLTIIRQTECQTTVRKAVKHFYYPLHKSVIYHHRKSTLKKNSWNSDILFKLQPSFPDCLQTDISNVGSNVRQFVPTNWAGLWSGLQPLLGRADVLRAGVKDLSMHGITTAFRRQNKIPNIHISFLDS